jgi:hypothetical protein
MADTPDTARHGGPLKRILANLNNPEKRDLEDDFVENTSEKVVVNNLARGNKTIAHGEEAADRSDSGSGIENNAQESRREQVHHAKKTVVVLQATPTKKSKKKELVVVFSSSESEEINSSDEGSKATIADAEATPNAQQNATNKATKTAPKKKKMGKKKSTKKGKKKQPSSATPVLNMPTTPTAATLNSEGSGDKKDSPSADTVPKTHVNALKMLEDGVFDDGYDSDGYIGPPRGTDQAELEALEEEAVVHNTPPEPPVEEEQEPPEEQPTHVPMTEAEIKQLTIPLIKLELRLRRIPFKASLKKDDLLAKLREALAQQSPKYTQEQLDAIGSGTKKKKEDDMTAFQVGAWWRELHPMKEQVDEPANEAFPAGRAPTIPEDDRQVPLKPKYNYAEKWDRIPFKGSAHGQERVKGRANDAFLKAHNLDKDSSPVEFAEAFLPMFKATKAPVPNPREDPVIKVKNLHGRFFSMEEAARVTNIRAERAFVGEATYKYKWEGPFSVKEIRQFLGLYVMNGLGPSPSLDKKFDRSDMANFNPFVMSNIVSGSPITRLKIFKAYFGIQDPDKEVPPRKDSPLFKVLPIIKQIRKSGLVAWDCGKNIAVDEQTISMKGHHADKIRITFKRAGDGFMCDALCDDGFTYSIYFRNEPPPPKYTAMGLSPLHARVMWLFDQLKDHGHRCRVDNLYMSAKFAKFCYNHDNKILLEGVASGSQFLYVRARFLCLRALSKNTGIIYLAHPQVVNFLH